MAKASRNVHDEIRGHFLLARLNVGGIFGRSVVWIYRFSEGEGASGLILNRPLGKTLAACAPMFAGTPAGSVPVFEGGPVEPDRLCFVVRSRGALDGNSSVRVGASPDEIRDVIFNPSVSVSGFAGRAEWARGQLEDELARGTWMRVRMDAEAWDAGGGLDFWRRMVAKIRRPEAALMLRAPAALEDN
ncbi:MAG: YqgE/AlgH family protein [Candidatus Spyradosoma sp.]